MEMLNAEKRLLHIVFNKPKVISDVNVGSLYSQLAIDIYNIAKKEITERALTSAINMTVVKSWYKDQYLPAIKNIFSMTMDLFDYSSDLINHILFDLEKEKSKYLNRKRLEQAILALDKGDLEEADHIVQLTKIKPVEQLKSTEALIASSLNDARIFASNTRLDKTIGLLRTKSMLAIAGEPGTMKTYFSMWYMIEILKANPTFTALYFEKEMPDSDIGLRLLAYLVGKDIQSISQLLYTEKQDDLIKIYRKIVEDNPDLKSIIDRFHVVPDYKFNNAADIEKYIKLYKADLYCVDYVQQMISESDMVKGTKTFVTELKEVTNNNDCFGILLSQVNNKEVARRANRICNATDMQYGTVIEQNCAQIITLFYPHKLFKGQQPMTTSRYKKGDYFTVAHKVRDAKEPDNLSYFQVQDNGFFTNVTDVENQGRMQNWINAYVANAENESKKYNRS